MRLLLASKIVSPPTLDEVQSVPDVWERLVVEAKRFLRAGGCVSPNDWLLFAECERAALDEATRIIAAEDAALAGIAGSGLPAALDVAAAADQGQARARVALEAAAKRAISKVMDEPPVPSSGISP